MLKILSLLLVVFSASLCLAVNDFEQLTANYNKTHLNRAANIKAADLAVKDQNTDGSFKSVRYEDKSRGLWKGMAHWSNLRVLAEAWNKTKDEKYRQAVIAGLNYWGKTMPSNSNWWWQEIGVPRQAIRVILNMQGTIPEETLTLMRGTFDRAKLRGTGQNLFDAAAIHIWKGVIYRDEKMVKDGVAGLMSVIKISPPGKEGLQSDYSFHQHGPQLQFGNYGKGYFENGTQFLLHLSGTGFAMPETAESLMWNYFYSGLRWTLYKKRMDILACGRQIWSSAPKGKYREIINNAGRFSSKNGMKQLVKEFAGADNQLEGSRYFFRSDYLVHRRKDLYFSYKMCSGRVIGSETINSENLQGLYLGCGVMQYKQTGTEYDAMPGLWDWRRLPGLTAVYDNDSLNAARARKKTNISKTVGAVSDNVNTGILLNSSSNKLGYFKSLAAVDRRIAFCVSNICNKTASPVNTTIDSRLYTEPVKVIFDGKSQVVTDGIHQLSGVRRIESGNVAYTFPAPQNLTIAIENKSVPWKLVAIDAKGNAVGKTVTIYIDHGSAKKCGDKICYVVSPANEHPAFEAGYFPCGHVIKESESNIAFAMFFAPGKMTVKGIGEISSDSKAAVMINNSKIYVADPCQTAKVINIAINGKTYSFNMPQGGFAGKSVSREL